MPATDTEAPSLQRSEAERRGRQLRVAHTTLELDLTDPGPTFGSRTTITFGTSEPGSETFLEFAGAELEAVELNGHPLDPARWVAGRIPLPDLRPDNSVTVRGRMAYSDDGEGLHRHVDPVDGRSYLYAMSFLNAGPRWFACFDQPDLKSTYELKVQAPQDWTVLGNGPSTQTGPGRWRIVPAAPLSTYFVTLVAGPYASKYDRHSVNGLDIPLGLHVRASLAEHLRHGGGRPVRGHEGELRLLPSRLRDSLPLRGVSPGLRARLQRRRDGEPRLCHVAGSVHLPVARHRRRPGRPGRRGRPRDGSHVVRRPGHHELVGRSVAERVVRRIPGPPLLRRSNPLSVVDRIRHPAQRLGFGRRSGARPPTPWPATAPSTRSRPCRTSTASPTPRAPRCSNSWRPTSGMRSSSPDCATTSAPTRYGNASFADLIAAWTRAGAVRARRLGRGVAAHLRDGHPHGDRVGTASRPARRSERPWCSPAHRAGRELRRGPGRSLD